MTLVSKFQITTLPDEFPDAHSIVNDLRLEYVVALEGVVRPRPAESVNKKMKTGLIEVSMLTIALFLLLIHDTIYFPFWVADVGSLLRKYMKK